jgi:hypothetical protein
VTAEPDKPDFDDELLRKLDLMTADLDWACEALDAIIGHLHLDGPPLELERLPQMRSRLRGDRSPP